MGLSGIGGGGGVWLNGGKGLAGKHGGGVAWDWRRHVALKGRRVSEASCCPLNWIYCAFTASRPHHRQPPPCPSSADCVYIDWVCVWERGMSNILKEWERLLVGYKLKRRLSQGSIVTFHCDSCSQELRLWWSGTWFQLETREIWGCQGRPWLRFPRSGWFLPCEDGDQVDKRGGKLLSLTLSRCSCRYPHRNNACWPLTHRH